MRDKDRSEAIVLGIIGAFAVLWLALLIAPYASGGLPGIIPNLPEVMDHPFHILFCDDTPKTVLILETIYGIIIGIYVKDSAYVKFHIKNSIRFAIASILVLLLMIIPFLGWIAAAICEAVLGVVKIIAIVWAFQGKAKELPIISSIGFLK